MNAKSALAKLANAMGYSVIRRTTFDTLTRESWLLREQASQLAAVQRELDVMASGQTASLRALDSSERSSRPSEGLYTPIYDYVGLRTDPRVLNAHLFMKDNRFVKAFKRGAAATQTDTQDYWRVHVALWCASHAANLNGDFVECGVWRGLLSSAIMEYLDWNILGRKFFLFDTFRGMDEHQLKDEEILKGNIAHWRKHYQEDVYADVVKNFAEFKNVTIIRGSVPDTLDSVEIGPICYLSIDMNNSAPEIAAANHFWDRLVPGAPILLDDYGFVSYEVQSRAFDDWAAQRNLPILALPTGQGLMIKP